MITVDPDEFAQLMTQGRRIAREYLDDPVTAKGYDAAAQRLDLDTDGW